jgi:hypothetical protein
MRVPSSVSQTRSLSLVRSSSWWAIHKIELLSSLPNSVAVLCTPGPLPYISRRIAREAGSPSYRAMLVDDPLVTVGVLPEFLDPVSRGRVHVKRAATPLWL